jgi:hypothetical protein
VIQIACIRNSNTESGTVPAQDQIHPHNIKTSDNTSQKTKIYQLLLFRSVYMVLVGKPEEKRPLGRPRRRRKDNIKMDFREVGCGGMGWMELAQDRDRCRTLVNAVMHLRVP